MTTVQIIVGIIALLVSGAIAHSRGFSKGLKHGHTDGFSKGKLFGLDQGYNMGFNEGRAQSRTLVVTATAGKKKVLKKKGK